jgi:hypothetical protein
VKEAAIKTKQTVLGNCQDEMKSQVFLIQRIMILCRMAFKGFCFDHFEQRFEINDRSFEANLFLSFSKLSFLFLREKRRKGFCSF